MAMIRGEARWAKIVGKPVEGYDEGELNKVWTFDLYVDDATLAKLADEGVPDSQIKTNKTTGEKFIKFTRKAYKKDGEAAKPIQIKNSAGEDWDGSLIGNGSIFNVRYNINEWTFGKKTGKRADALAVQVWEHVKYEGGESFPTKQVEMTEDGQEKWEA